ncbi:MAG: hypothetical protein EBR79_01915 [Proteobacteria bacterium]|nr:hypothetical protein [Pseudomonadota bacterium]NBX85852.1 hypothetical protein [Pseudomonadota bacterium]
MPKPIAANPKANLLRGIATKLHPVMHRIVADIARATVNNTSAQREAANAQKGLAMLLRGKLEATGLPVLLAEDPAPAEAPNNTNNGHWRIVLPAPRNLLYARQPLTLAVAFIAPNGTCPIGAIYQPMEDITIIAETGQGATCESHRLRCANRTTLADALALLPFSTPDVAEHKLIEKTTTANLHTRKSGSTLADVADIALARADLAFATRLSTTESLLANLLLAESGAFASDFAGKPLGPHSTTLVAANPKLHPQALKLTNK